MQIFYNFIKQVLNKLQQFISKFPLIILLLLTTCVLLSVYKDVLIEGKILFPANHMAHFYSPWSTEKFEGWEHGIPNKPIGTDPIRFFYPGWSFAIDEVKEGRLPLWNPYIFTGNVHLANFQSGIFFPPNWIYFLIPQYAAWVILHFLPFYLAAIGTYLFLKKLKISSSGAIFGALLFTFSGYMTSWSQENTVVPMTASLLPWFMLVLAYCVDSFKRIYFISFSIIWALVFLAGHFQTAFYITIFGFIFYLLQIRSLKIPKDKKIKYIGQFGLFFLLGIGLTAIQLLPSIEAFSYSPRPSVNAFETIQGFLVPITHIFNLFVTDWYGNIGTYNYSGPGFYHETTLSLGITAIIFAIYGFFKRSYESKFFFLAALVTFFLSVDNPITAFVLSQPLPLISTFVPSRIFVITTFCIAVLAAYGFSEFFKATTEQKKQLLRKVILASFGIILIANLINIIAFTLDKEQFLNTQRTFLDLYKTSPQYIALKNSVPVLIVLFLLFFLTLKRMALLLGIFVITLFFQSRLLNKLFMPGEQTFFYPDHFVFTTLEKSMDQDDRFITYGKQIFPNLHTKWKIASPEGLDPIYNYRYGQLIDAINHNGIVDDSIPRVEARFNELNKGEQATKDQLRMNVLSLLGVNYIAYYENQQEHALPVAKVFPTSEFPLVASQDNWHIVKNTKALPHAFLTDAYIVENDMQKAVKLMSIQNFLSKKSIILEEKLPITTGKASQTDKAEMITYGSQLIKVKTSTANNQLLFLSDTYYPGWEALIDGTPTNIYRANTAFRAITVPQGTHEVTFQYKPQSLYFGAIISSITFLLLLSLAVINLHRSKKARS